jgi:TolB-like protein
MSFIAELKRRNVIRMAGLYLVGAWLLVQVASTLFPAFGVPGWALRGLVILLALGFVPAIVFAWVFEMTPDGLKRDEDIAPGQSIAPQTAQRMNRLIIAVLMLALVYFGFDKFVLQHRREVAQVAPTAEIIQPAAAVVAETTVAPGVAVLPFENMSPDPDNAFFAGGVFEEVLTKLSKVPQLRVISRTSMEQIAKQNLEASAIGKRLGVSHVLEGSVRRAGDRVRVTVQLIEAATDNHVWAENYDRKLDDVFAIQSEIALAIADQLKVTLSPQLQSNLSDRPTKNQAAYDLYLRAVNERRVWRGAPTFRAIITLLEPAVAADPDFVRARVLLAESYGRMYWLGEDPDNQYMAKARALVADISTRWPDRPDSYLAQAQLLYNVDRNYEAALQGFRAIEAAMPGDVAVLSGISSCFKRLGRAKEFLAAVRRWQSVDPESPLIYSELMFALDANRLYDEEIALGEEGVRKFPEDESAAYTLAMVKLAHRGDIDAVIDYGRRFKARSDSRAANRVAIARFVKGDIDGALALRGDLQSDNPIVDAIRDAAQADWMQLAGRGGEAQALAARALAVVSAAIAEGRPAPRGQAAWWYSNAAAIAALAGDRAKAAAWEKKAVTASVKGLEEKMSLAGNLADLRRFSGDPEGAWRLMATTIDAFNGTPKGELLAFKPYYDKLYGQSPSYRAYMAKLAVQP